MSYRANILKKIRRMFFRNFFRPKTGHYFMPGDGTREQVGRILETKGNEFISMRAS